MALKTWRGRPYVGPASGSEKVEYTAGGVATMKAGPLQAVLGELKAVQASRVSDLEQMRQEKATTDARARRIIADVKAGRDVQALLADVGKLFDAT